MTRKLLRAAATALVAVVLLLPGPAASAAPTANAPLPVTAAGSGTGTADPSQPDAPVSPMIIRGRPASQTYKGLGSLQYQRGDDPNWHTCAVDLWWTRRHAVTNAHCVTNYPVPTIKDPSIYKIRWNSNDRLHGGQVTGVTKIKVFPDWDWGAEGGQFEGDAAVLELTSPVYGVPNILPPPFGRWPGKPDSRARIVGWGFTSQPFEGATPRHLSEADTGIVDPSYCAAAAIDAREVCVLNVKDPATSACYGDSGGPVLVPTAARRTWLMVGTASRETSTDCSGATVYTSLSAYADWFNQQIADGMKPDQPKRQAPKGALPARLWAGCGTNC